MQAREDEEKPQKIGAFGAAYWPYDKRKNQKCIYMAPFQLLASRLKFSFTRLFNSSQFREKVLQITLYNKLTTIRAKLASSAQACNM